MERREFIKFRQESPISNLDGFRLDPHSNDDDFIQTQTTRNVSTNDQLEVLNINENNLSINVSLRKSIGKNFDSDSEDEYRNLMNSSTQNPSTASTYTNSNSRFNSSSQFSRLDMSAQKPKAKKKSSLGMISDLNWSKRVGNYEVLRNQQILYKLIQKHSSNTSQVNHKCMR